MVAREAAAHLPTARTALRRSLILWGWGQASLGLARAWALAAVEVVALAFFLVVGLSHLTGSEAGLLFAAGAAFFAAWAGIGIDAYRRAVRTRSLAGLAGEDGGALDLLWMAAPLIVASTLFWTTGGSLGSPQAALARYVTDWRQGRPEDAGLLFDSAPVPSTVELTWGHQASRLHDELVSLAASTPGSGIDPDAPFDSLRIELADAASGDGADREAVFRIVRRQAYAGTFLGMVQTTSERLVDLADVGHARLRPSGSEWRIVEVDLLGERLGTP